MTFLKLSFPRPTYISVSTPIVSDLISVKYIIPKLFEGIDAKLSDEERKGRIDIQYRKAAGQHVIIELKRPNRTVSVYDLGKQIEKYRSGMLKILEQMDLPHEPVEFVCLLSKPPVESANPNGKEVVRKILEAQNARYVDYDVLLSNAYRSYQDYLIHRSAMDRIHDVIKEIDDYGAEC